MMINLMLVYMIVCSMMISKFHLLDPQLQSNLDANAKIFQQNVESIEKRLKALGQS